MSTAYAPTERYTASIAYLRQYLADLFPHLDLRTGRVLNDVMLKPAAEVHALDQETMDLYRRASSLQEIIEDPELAAVADVDRLASNFRITRKAGTPATGQVAIIVSGTYAIVVAEGSLFTANGLRFRAASTFTTTTGALVNPTDRLLIARDDGTYYFLVDVEADNVGSQYQLRQDTDVTWVSPSDGYVRAYANEDFTGGTTGETNKQLVDRLDIGLTAPAMAGRSNIESLLRNQFSSITDVSIVGAGDVEMVRDSHNLFGYKVGGKADLYLRTTDRIQRKVVTASATLVNVAAKTMQLSIGRNDYPGYYFVGSILPVALAGTPEGALPVTQELRGTDTTDLSYVAPYIHSDEEATYSRFQTAVIQFTDTTLDTSEMAVGSTAEYRVELLGIPDIGDIQDYVSARSRRAPQADYLVYAPTPILVAVSVQLDKAATDADPDTAAVKQSVAAAVNATTFRLGHLAASRLVDAAQNVLSGRVAVREPINMMAVLRMQDGTVRRYNETSDIRIYEPELGLTNRNTAYYTDETMISVNVATYDVLEP